MQNEKSDPTKHAVISSPGPTSEIGKAISSRNSLKHGCCSSDVLILKTENPDDFKSIETIWFKTYEPKVEAETHLVKELINADFLLQRSTRTVAEVEARLLEENSNPLDWTEQQQRTFGRFLRYQTTRSNTV